MIYRTKFVENKKDDLQEYGCYVCCEWPNMSMGEGSWKITKFSWTLLLRLINPFYIEKKNPFYKITIVCKECSGTGFIYY